MLDKEIIKHFNDGDEELYIVEYVVSSILPKDIALEEYNELNMKTIDKGRLYKVNKDCSTELIKEKGCGN